MSAPDEAMLSAEERAALAHLEARAAADDPGLADHLRGTGPRRRLGAALARVGPLAAHVWARMSPRVFGPILAVAGLALVVIGLSVSIVVSVAGVAIAAAGIAQLLGVAVRMIAARR